jgi:hypothetical protein
LLFVFIIRTADPGNEGLRTEGLPQPACVTGPRHVMLSATITQAEPLRLHSMHSL